MLSTLPWAVTTPSGQLVMGVIHMAMMSAYLDDGMHAHRHLRPDSGAASARRPLPGIRKNENKMDSSWLSQAWLRQDPPANGPQGDYLVGHQT